MNAWPTLDLVSQRPLTRDSGPTGAQILWAGGRKGRRVGFVRSSTGFEINANVKPGRLSVAKMVRATRQNARPQVGSNVRTK
jgi:hypothetical protein